MSVTAVVDRDAAKPNPSDRAQPMLRRGETVLLVDDEPSMRSLYGLRLREHGAPVAIACSAAEAIELLATRSFDVVISDYSMAGATGLDLLAYVTRRRLPVRFVLTSAALPSRVRAEAEDAGAIVIDKLELMRRL